MMKAQRVKSRRRNKQRGAEVQYRSLVTVIGEKGLGLIQHMDKPNQNGFQIDLEIIHQEIDGRIEENKEIDHKAHQIEAGE
jgi:uncharacterized protein YkvS